ncbi:MAG: efflux RND transporter periplasmic adaptor subunit [Myxococcales bacterium]|nr:MAG: efflux RND transporter periplasmic adaptor subunit [Myxococcales bacterium]
MSSKSFSTLRRGVAGFVLVGIVLGTGGLLAGWKQGANRDAAAAAASQPEPVERVTLASAAAQEHHATTTAIGTVLALRSITLKNEVAGSVARVSLKSGEVVEPGTVLVALDASVELAELRALEAQARLAETMAQRREELLKAGATTQDEVDQTRAQRDVAHAQSARLRAVIAKKTLRAPFRARVGLSDVHPGQYLNVGAELTTLQGVAEEVHVDFSVAQSVAAGIELGSSVEVRTSQGKTLTAKVVAVDSRVDPTTRSALVRARLQGGEHGPAPGASVRVVLSVGASGTAVVVPVSALRKGPDGDHVWVVSPDAAGALRAHERKVESGPALGETVIVLAGLTAGEQLAASGSFKLREGVKVQAAEPTAASSVGSAGK